MNNLAYTLDCLSFHLILAFEQYVVNELDRPVDRIRKFRRHKH